MAPRGPPKGQKSILMGSLVVLDPNASPKKISSIFGTGCHKACTCPLNGAIYNRLQAENNFVFSLAVDLVFTDITRTTMQSKTPDLHVLETL